MIFQKPVTDIITERISTRSYSERDIEKDSLDSLQAAIDEINAGMHIRARFQYLDMPWDSEEHAGNGRSGRSSRSGDESDKLGTYGMIAGSHSYLVGIIDKDEKDVAEFGFQFERLILFATGLGLQTCWLGGTFDRESLGKKVVLSENEFIPIISPVGYKREKTRIMDSVIRAAVGANRRKPWEQLFFNDSMDAPMEKYQAADYSVCLEMVRLAPSASNKQPWRVIRDDTGLHFFVCRNKGYGPANFDIQKSDVGIAMCHFDLAAKEKGLTGEWADRTDVASPDEWEYVRTWNH